MSFLVCEPDPLVREDISETLSYAFGGLVVTAVETLEDAANAVRGLTGPIVAVLSISGEASDALLDWVFQNRSKAKVVLVSNNAPDSAEATMYSAFVQRPFTADVLMAAVRTALSDQHSSQT